ncbi:hypothetical protein FGSG_13814 [Fusarium graminearum PH-1]|uniref:hypothetical protein n=1 Tax=Gibberella zeae (strain ATCC MYA-4620 / CBS 123657 / FGSC 9075 / NRRL 31084 / PH-1) TaxID=229533 RepID=UPI00021F1C15|nr:hypothetical protein FGSG_13814 [Fusarium graminearum PH-1]ESU17454.1 hypothetical protein FGSG_13814 [Fusarium graminearum PH-1]|eukprot:XP_011319716.1 hypothetical protein FGSG_13814 [Fusarium graminearum PH-1]
MADMGGTDLPRALKSTVQRRLDNSKSTQIVILTDGELDPEEPMELPIKPATIQDGTMHRLAAKATLMDLEDLVKRQPSGSRLAEENAQRIGITYSITSKWTSFVAIPQDEPANTEGSMMEHYKAMMDGIDMTELLSAYNEDESEIGHDILGYVGDEGSRTYASDDGKYGEILPISMVREAGRLSDGGVGGSSRYNTLHITEEGKEDERYVISYGTAKPVTDGPNIGTGNIPAKERGDASEGDPMNDQVGFEWVRKKDRPRSKSDQEDLIRKYLAEYRTGAIVTETSGPLILNGLVHSESGSSGTGSVSHDSSEAMDPLDWEMAVKHQNGQGLFELPEEARSILHLHFCPKTRSELAVRLSKILHDQELEPDLCIQIVDSMMIIKCYQTHLAATEDIWDLMMERAQDAIAEVIGQDTLVLFEEVLTGSMMHQHYKAAIGEREQDGGLTGGATCPDGKR